MPGDEHQTVSTWLKQQRYTTGRSGRRGIKFQEARVGRPAPPASFSRTQTLRGRKQHTQSTRTYALEMTLKRIPEDADLERRPAAPPPPTPLPPPESPPSRGSGAEVYTHHNVWEFDSSNEEALRDYCNNRYGPLLTLIPMVVGRNTTKITT